MKVIITGATGMVGKGILLECLDHESISEILVIGRSKVGIEHPKLKELIHKDFTNFSDVKEKLNDYDACFFSLGISSQGLNKEDYKIITYDFTLALAKTLFEINPEMTFNYVSAAGADSLEKSRMFWACVRGKTENDLLQMGFKQAFMFRPGAIIPLRGTKSKTKSTQFLYDYFMWLVKAIKAFAPNLVVDTTQIGLAMINSVTIRYTQKVLNPKDIIVLSK